MQVKRMSALPANARQYVQFVSETVGVPVSIISVGPGREQVIEV
jgi:adenylosuccinate synthase